MGASLARGSVSERIYACLSRPISNDLAEKLAYRTVELERYLQLLLEVGNSGFVNALSVVMAAVQQCTLTPESGESALTRALGGKEISHASLVSTRLEGLRFSGWEFRFCDFNEAHLVNCEFIGCDFTTSSVFGTVVIGGRLEDSDFGDASLVNSLGIVQDDEIERLYDNKEIRLWLRQQQAKVRSDDLSILTEKAVPVNELLEHIFRRFYPTGSSGQHHVLETSLTKSLPSHRIAEVRQLANWLLGEQVITPGPLLRGRTTVEISPEWRADISTWMRDGDISDRIKALIASSLEQ